MMFVMAHLKVVVKIILQLDRSRKELLNISDLFDGQPSIAICTLNPLKPQHVG